MNLKAALGIEASPRPSAPLGTLVGTAASEAGGSRTFLTGEAARQRAVELAAAAPDPQPKGDRYVSLADALKSGEVEVMAVSGSTIYVVSPKEIEDPAKRQDYARKAQEAENWIAANDPTGGLMRSLDGSRLGAGPIPRMILLETPERGDDPPYDQLFRRSSGDFNPAEASLDEPKGYNGNFDRIAWSPERGIKFAGGSSVPPAGILAHELFHNLQLANARAENPGNPLAAVSTRLSELLRDTDGNGSPQIEDDATRFERSVLLNAARSNPAIKPREDYGTERAYEFTAPQVTSTDGDPALQEPGF